MVREPRFPQQELQTDAQLGWGKVFVKGARKPTAKVLIWQTGRWGEVHGRHTSLGKIGRYAAPVGGLRVVSADDG